MHLQSLVVAGALDVFADDQVVAQTRCATLQNQHLKGIQRQTVTPQGSRTAHGHAGRHRRCIQSLLVTQTPNAIRTGAFEAGKIEIRFVRRRQNVVVLVAHQKHVFAFHGVAVIPEGHQGAVLCQTRLCVGISPCSKHGPSVTRRGFTRFADQFHWIFCNADAPTSGHRGHGLQRGPIFTQDDVVRNGVHQQRVVPKTLHVDCCAEKNLQHLACVFIQHRQAGKCCGRVAQVRKTHDLRAQVCAECRVCRVVERQMPSFTRQHVGRAWAQRLHHKGLIKSLTPIRHPRQSIGSRIGPRT